MKRDYGLSVNETANSATVRQSPGNEGVVPRSQIAKMLASRLSLKPEGLEEGLTHQDPTAWIRPGE